MAEFRPFAAFRPAPGLADRIAALPYDVYSRAEAKEAVRLNPRSFLAIDRAETFFDESVGTFDDCVYEKARELLWDCVAKGDFVQDPAPCFYLYELTMDGRTQTGIAGCASIDDYLDGTIKKHENTRADKELDRIRHVDACDMQTGPIFLCCRQNSALDAIVREVKEQSAPACDFVSDHVRHRVFVINDNRKIDKISAIFRESGTLYIADGHHRCASAVKVGLKRRAAAEHLTGTEEFNYFLSVVFPQDELRIMDYNRAVRDLAGMDSREFLEKLQERFEVSAQDSPVCPRRKGEFGLCLSDGWYRLTLREGLRGTDPVSSLDVSVLQELVLAPLLGITNPKEDQRISFVGGIRGLEELERMVGSGYAAAFSMFPTSMEELMLVADAGLLMPPKSTWFEPKLLSGLFLHSLRG